MEDRGGISKVKNDSSLNGTPSREMMTRIHLGCGKNIRQGWINVDSVSAPGVNKVINLEKFPYPFASNSAQEIMINHCLEHLQDPDKVIHELHRILRSGGKLTVRVPHFTSSGAFSPLHKTYWHTRIFDHYVKNKSLATHSLEEHKPLFASLRKRIRFTKGFAFWNHLIEWVVNINDATRRVYECHFCFIFPAFEIIAEYRK